MWPALRRRFAYLLGLSIPSACGLLYSVGVWPALRRRFAYLPRPWYLACPPCIWRGIFASLACPPCILTSQSLHRPDRFCPPSVLSFIALIGSVLPLSSSLTVASAACALCRVSSFLPSWCPAVSPGCLRPAAITDRYCCIDSYSAVGLSSQIFTWPSLLSYRRRLRSLSPLSRPGCPDNPESTLS